VAAPAERRRLPDWLKVRPPGGEEYKRIKEMRTERNLATVCEEAECPNVGECWGGGTATFMVMGDACTRGCRFCAVDTEKDGPPLDPLEPSKLAASVQEMDLEYVVVTSVDRDDLPDQGASHVATCIDTLHKECPDTLVEFLIPDFQGEEDLIATVVDAEPHVLAHNVETVRRLTPTVRDARAGYDQSLEVLRFAKRYAAEVLDVPMYTKSSIMVGLGETEEEVVQTMEDLREVGVDFLTIGQYLRPSDEHLAVDDFVHPDTFDRYEEIGREKGFKYVASGPLVRSSYRAGEYYITNVIESGEGPSAPALR
jgi:lipoic acid synthetase